jgi:outer membrane murein-binding lipoprotein Lpp
MRDAYVAAVEDWIAAIRKEEALASATKTLAQVDRWEHAHFDEEAARDAVKAAKAKFEEALRARFFDL